MELGNIASAVFLLDQKVDIEEFISKKVILYIIKSQGNSLAFLIDRT